MNILPPHHSSLPSAILPLEILYSIYGVNKGEPCFQSKGFLFPETSEDSSFLGAWRRPTKGETARTNGATQHLVRAAHWERRKVRLVPGDWTAVPGEKIGTLELDLR
jgi:hypothetical protein